MPSNGCGARWQVATVDCRRGLGRTRCSGDLLGGGWERVAGKKRRSRSEPKAKIDVTRIVILQSVLEGHWEKEKVTARSWLCAHARPTNNQFVDVEALVTGSQSASVGEREDQARNASQASRSDM